jgi:transcriptional regulator NrdR family protein
MTTVIKRDGSRQKFSPSKIKKAIASALRSAKVPKKKADVIVAQVGGSVVALFKKRKLVKAADIGKAVGTRLATKSKAAAAKWRGQEKKKTQKAKKKGTAKKTAKKRRVVRRKRRR